MSDEFTGKVIADKYRVESLLRRGDTGDLYRAVHVLMDKPVAIRLLPSVGTDATKLFFDDARMTSHIEHPNILNVSDFGTDVAGVPYIVYEPVDGTTLQEILAREGQLPAETALSIAAQTSAGLAATHAGGVIHGNLTPANILVGREENAFSPVKLVDFGSPNPIIADRHGDSSPAEFAYLAPEQCSGAEGSDARGDIYSLGAILYEMLAGTAPFVGERPTDVMQKHIEEAPPPLSAFRTDLHESIEPAMLKALAKDPAMRYKSASEFGEVLDTIRTDTSGKAAAAGAAAGNNIWKTAFVVLAGIAVLAVALIYGTSVKQTDPTTALQPDANGQPVQPIGPATGTEEQNLAQMSGMMPQIMSNSNMAQPPGTLPGGDNYNPWASGTTPPPGGPPQYIGPGGQVYTIDPNTGSPFMQPEGGVVLVPIPANTNTAVKPTPTPKTNPANTNVAPSPTGKPAPDLKGTPVKEPVKPPAKTPDKPAANKPADNSVPPAVAGG